MEIEKIHKRKAEIENKVFDFLLEIEKDIEGIINDKLYVKSFELNFRGTFKFVSVVIETDNLSMEQIHKLIQNNYYVRKHPTGLITIAT